MTETIILTLVAFVTSILSAVIGMGGGVTLLGIMAILIPEGYMGGCVTWCNSAGQ